MKKNSTYGLLYEFGLFKMIRIMRFTIFILFLSLTQAFAVNSYSQQTKLSLDMRNARIEEVIDRIEKNTEFFFLYNRSLIDVDRKVDIRAEEKNVSEVLDNLFRGTDVSYSIKDRQILLINNNIFGYINEISQQQKSVSGKVTDGEGNPLPGVSVVVKGTSNGVISDENGKYSISRIPEKAVLQFSFVGMKTQEVQVGSNSKIDIALVDETIGIEEVVAVGYGTTSKKNLTTSISKVKTDEVSKVATSNVNQILMGRVSGLQATVASSQPGGNVNMSIRGGGTPIYVVDGVVIPSSSLEGGSGGSVTVIPNNVDRAGLAGLNPEDIESVEVLKDASASIYGIGAASGVILITTKKGKEGKLKIEYDGSYSTVSNYKIPDPLDAQQYMTLVNVYNKEQYLYNNKMAPYGNAPYTNLWTAPFSDAAIAEAKNTDWKNMVLRTGSVTNHNLVLRGGTQVVNYYVSGNYYFQEGSVSNSSMERFAIRSNIGIQLNSFIKLTSIINANRNNYNNSAVGGTSNGRGIQAGGALTTAMSYPTNMPLRDADGKYSVFMNLPNPVGLEDLVDRTNTNGVILNFAADFTIVKDMLTAKLLYGNNLENSRRNTYIPTTVYFDQMYKSRGNLGTDTRQNQTMEATISFNKKIGKFLNFDAVVGIGKYLNDNNRMNVAYDGQHDAIANDNLESITGVVSPSSYLGLDEKRSQFIRANFDILDRFVIATTVRRDGTDKFFPSKKYAFFPSISTAWKMKNESFLKEVRWINMLKLRASYGETGNDNLGTTLYGTYGPFGNQIMFNNNSVKYIPIVNYGLDYPDVSWEKTIMKNIGLDFSIFKDRVSGGLDFFQNDITNRLGTANTSGLSMFGTYPINGSHIRRKGWDANISTKNYQGKAFSWTSILTLSRYNALWIERMPNYDYNTYEKRGVVDQNIRYFYQTNGLINADKSNMPASQPIAAQMPGYPIIVDQNNDGTITIDDIKTRNEVPDIYFGFGNTFNYKNFDLDIFMYSQVGITKRNSAFSGPGGLANQSGNNNNYAYRIWNSQTNPNGTLPGIASSLASVTLPGGCGTDVNYQDASFLRVRNITLGYNIAGNKLGTFGTYVSNLRIYFDAQNPITFTKFEGYDPEVGGSGAYPQTRTFSAGVKISL